jgi:hypothetical protein
MSNYIKIKFLRKNIRWSASKTFEATSILRSSVCVEGI